MQSGFFERNDHGTFLLFALEQRTLRMFKIATEQEENWRLFGQRILRIAMKCSPCAGREPVEINRRMSA